MAETAAPHRPADERLARVNIVARARRAARPRRVLSAPWPCSSSSPTRRGNVSWLSDLGIWSQWLDQSAQYGIVAVPVALLMIGGEFDLSAGVMVGSSGLLLGLLTTRADWNVWPSIAVVLLFGAAIGFINGYTVVQDEAAELHRHARDVLHPAGRQRRRHAQDHRHRRDQRHRRRAPASTPRGPSSPRRVWSPYDFKVNVIWWLGLTVLGAWLLARTRFGNWIFAVGGDPVAARNVGVPVARTKIALFMMTSTTSALLGIITAIGLRGIQANEGVGREFIFIIAAVVGGCLLTGGYGSVVGAAFGAAILGMASIGIILSQWDSNWVYAFQGVILVLAVMLNAAIRARAAGARSR